jgi:hypothetical protein
MKQLQDKVKTRLEDPAAAAAWVAATGGTPEQCPPIYSFDNPSIHVNDKSYLHELGLVQDDLVTPTNAWLKLPPYSGDLHRTIERVHARVCRAFQRWFDDEFADKTMLEYCRRLAGFFETQTPGVIHSCMFGRHPLIELYQTVVASKGAKAHRPYC